MELDGDFALSPDGSRLAFSATSPSGNAALYVRSMHEADFRRIEGTSGGTHLFWSADGRWLGYFDDQKLKKISVDGDSIMKLAADDVAAPLSQTTGWAATAPSFLDDGVHFVFTAGTSPPKAYVASIASDQVDELPTIHSLVVPDGDGHLLFVDGGRLLAQPFNLPRLRLEGQPTEIARGIAYAGNGLARVSAAAENGILAFHRGGNLDLNRMVWFDRPYSRSVRLAGRNRSVTSASLPISRRWCWTSPIRRPHVATCGWWTISRPPSRGV